VISPTPSEIQDFFFVFGRVEGAMAAMAAERREDREIRLLRATQRQIMQLTPRKGESINEPFVELVADFHRQVHKMSHSKYEAERASRSLRMSEFFLFNSNAMNVPGGASLAIADKERAGIVEAIADRDAAAASQLMEKHVRGKPGAPPWRSPAPYRIASAVCAARTITRRTGTIAMKRLSSSVLIAGSGPAGLCSRSSSACGRAVHPDRAQPRYPERPEGECDPGAHDGTFPAHGSGRGDPRPRPAA